MTARSPSAFLLSATLHALVAGLLLLLSYTASRHADEVPKIFQIVAGPGSDYLAREAPALGTPGGLKIETTMPPTPQPAAEETRQAAKPEPAPFTPAPVAPPAPKQAPKQTPPAPKKQTTERVLPNVRRDVIRAESKAKQQLEKQWKEDAKKLAEERKREAELEAQQKAKNAKSSPGKVARVDVEGIQKGVLGGSANSKEGAGGRALRADNDDVLGAYFEMFKERVRDRCEPPPGLSESVRGEFEFTIHADGSISGARVVKSSGNTDFDHAVLDAIRRVKMPAHPNRKSESVKFTYSMRDQNRG